MNKLGKCLYEKPIRSQDKFPICKKYKGLCNETRKMFCKIKICN